MNLAVMQPYIFPYIGYFQLICASHIFVVYDDVSYIKRGYINSNKVLSKGGPVRITIPVHGASQNRLISELKFSTDVVKVLRTIEHNYSKAPYFKDIYPIIERVLMHEDRSIASVCTFCYQAIFSYLDIFKKFKRSSDIDYNRSGSAEARLIDLCHKFDAECYINAPGGKSLYQKKDFSERGVELKFINPLPIEYPQCGKDFVPNLSIIDLLMNCSPEEVRSLLSRYALC